MKQYTRFFEDEAESSLSDLTDDTIPEKIVDFIIKNPFPKDEDQIHKFAKEELKIDPDKLEQYIYAFLTVILTGGKSKGKEVEGVSKENLDIGHKIELEHVDYDTNNKVVKEMIKILSNKIVMDHSSEDIEYYSKNINFKDELKQEGK